MSNKWVVTRQHYWGVENPYAVEIAGGGLDYCNPDALAAKYRGEFEEFTDPREAVKTALEIAAAWRNAPNAARSWTPITVGDRQNSTCRRTNLSAPNDVRKSGSRPCSRKMKKSNFTGTLSETAI